jgi:hypothetical protein
MSRGREAREGAKPRRTRRRRQRGGAADDLLLSRLPAARLHSRGPAKMFWVVVASRGCRRSPPLLSSLGLGWGRTKDHRRSVSSLHRRRPNKAAGARSGSSPPPAGKRPRSPQRLRSRSCIVRNRFVASYCRAIQSPWIMYPYAYRPSRTFSSPHSREKLPTNQPTNQPRAGVFAAPGGRGGPRLLLRGGNGRGSPEELSAVATRMPPGPCAATSTGGDHRGEPKGHARDRPAVLPRGGAERKSPRSLPRGAAGGPPGASPARAASGPLSLFAGQISRREEKGGKRGEAAPEPATTPSVAAPELRRARPPFFRRCRSADLRGSQARCRRLSAEMLCYGEWVI